MPTKRDNSIDLVRGAVMCVMVLDHVRDFFTQTPFSPTNATKTHAALFFTRFITHFCAPTFMLLAGAGAGLAQRAGRSTSWLVEFLLSRGLWLVVLEITLVRLGWTFDPGYHFTALQVIWALGWSMVFLAVVVPLGPTIAGALGFVIVLVHNVLDKLQPLREEHLSVWWKIFHTGGALELAANHDVYVAYPLVPWIGLIALGYLLGSKWKDLDRRLVIGIGAICVAAFFVVRSCNGYGDPHPRDLSLHGERAIFSFLDCQKYPPSLDYLLMTVGPTLMLLGFLKERALDGGLAKMLVVYGRAPLFFYLLHIPLVHAMSLPFRALHDLPMVSSAFRHGLDEPLWLVYVVWLSALAVLYFPTRAWARLKAERDTWWLRYL